MIALLALWYDVLRFGRPLMFVVIIAISGLIRLVRRGKGSRRSPVPPNPFQQQQYPQQPYPPQGYGQQPYPQQPYPQPGMPQFTSPPPLPTAPFAHPISDPFAPNPLAGHGDRPRSTPLPPLFGSDAPPPPPGG